MTERELRLGNVQRCRRQLVKALPPPLRKTVRGGAGMPTRRLEDHAEEYSERMWGPDAATEETVKACLVAFRAGVEAVMTLEADTIARLVHGDPEKLGTAFEVARRRVASEAGVPAGDPDFERYLGRAISGQLRRERMEDRWRAVAEYAIAHLEESEGVISAEASLRLHSTEESAKWRAFFGYAPAGDTREED